MMHINISISQQTLALLNERDELLAQYLISTATNGVGCEKGSGCTPLGQHIIRAKIGASAPINAVFVGRRATGEICTPELMVQFPHRDWILTRILWLSGSELGINRLGNVDTMQRFIYIHGAPDSAEMGETGSHGCIRMRNQELVELFDRVPAGTPVFISLD